jgi:peptide/nickel transport system permease protein
MSARVRLSPTRATSAKTAERRSTGFLLLTLGRIVRRPLGKFGAVATALLVVMALAAPLLAPYSPYVQHEGQELLAPSAKYLLGTDDFGRDILSRVIYGSRLSFLVGIVSVLLGVAVGVTSGLVAGSWGGWVEGLTMRFYDALMAFPAILLGIAVATVLGPGVINAAIAVGIVSMPQFARIARAAMLAEKGKDYVSAARTLGASDTRIVFRHVLPNATSPVLVQMSLAMAFAVLLEASLSFLGLGAQPPEPSWGSMLNTSRSFLRQAPWYGIVPGVFLSLLLLALNLLADAVRDALDPRQINLA